jgi:hypothetical protein
MDDFKALRVSVTTRASLRGCQSEYGSTVKIRNENGYES